MGWPDLAPLGPFFALQTPTGQTPTGQTPRDAGLRALSDLAADDTPLRTRVDATLARLSVGAPGLSRRVAASAVQLGLTARLVSPALAGAVLGAVVPDLSEGRTWWSADPESGPFVVPDIRLRETDTVDDTVQAILELVVTGSVATLVHATRQVTPVAEQILWGNVASALAGAATVIAAVHPERATRARETVSALVRSPRLAGTGAYVDRQFRRGTCCLFYLAPGGGLCGDCVLSE